MFSPELYCNVVESEDENEEDQIYQFIYDMINTDEKAEEEEDQIPPCFGPTPVHLNIRTESDGSVDNTTHSTTEAQRLEDQEVDNRNGSDMEPSDSIQGIPVVDMNAEEKPWRKSRADITDYFNYGFDEKSWNTYYKKQLKLHAANRKLYKKSTVQKGHTRHEEEKSCSSSPSSDSPSLLAPRESSPTIDVIEGRPGPSVRVEHCPCPSAEGNNTQVVTEMSPEEDRITSYHLPPPSNSAYTTPPSFLYQREPPSLSPLDTSESGHCQGIDDPSTSLCSYSSGESSSIPRSMASRAGLIDTAKAWECYIWQEKCDKYRDRSREHGHDKGTKRGRDRERESCSPLHNSSRSKRDGGEDSQSRHKHKKTKRQRQDKKTKKMFSADQKRKLKSA